MASLNITNIPAPRVPFIDERTGLMAREWYRFFLNLFVLTGSGNNPITLEELQLGPPSQQDCTEIIAQVANNFAPQYEDQSGDFLATLDTAQLMSMMARFENLEAAIQGAYLNPPQIPATGGEVVGPSSSTDNAIARFDGTSGKVIQNSVTTIDDTGNASGILSQQFSDGTAVTLAAGKMWYDGATGAWNAGMGNGNITQQIGEEIFVYGKASAAITDSPLQIIYHTGVVGASGAITFAPTIAGITDVNAIIGVATESLALNGFGRATVFGVVHGITTNGTAFGEVWADDDVIWYNPVTGNPTKVEPVAPYIKVQVGLVIKAGAGGSGSFQVGIARGSKLGGTDSNVQFSALANNNLITYDTGVGYWKNTATGTGVVTALGVAVGSAGAFVVNGGALGTPSSGTVTNLTGTASININGTVGATTANTGAFTTLASSSDATLHGLTVGMGLGSVATNTAVGASALAANTTGGQNTAVGSSALAANTSGTNNVAIGTGALAANQTGTYNVAIGYRPMYLMTANTGSQVAIGYFAAYNRTASTGETYASTFVGSQAGYINSTGIELTYIGGFAGRYHTGSYNTAVGSAALYGAAGGSSTGTSNTVIGYSSGSGITSGSKNTIIGTYSGAAAPISATGSNYVVLSDGDANIVASTKTAQTFALQGGTLSAGTGIAFPATQSASSDANTLDDYEEGTWTPNQGSGLVVVGAFSSVGNYVKIGRVVTVQGYLSGATSVSVPGGFNILTSNLPFSCNTNQTPAYAGNGAASAFAGTYVNALTIGSIETISATSNIYFFATYYTST